MAVLVGLHFLLLSTSQLLWFLLLICSAVQNSFLGLSSTFPFPFKKTFTALGSLTQQEIQRYTLKISDRQKTGCYVGVNMHVRSNSCNKAPLSRPHPPLFLVIPEVWSLGSSWPLAPLTYETRQWSQTFCPYTPKRTWKNHVSLQFFSLRFKSFKKRFIPPKECWQRLGRWRFQPASTKSLPNSISSSGWAWWCIPVT